MNLSTNSKYFRIGLPVGLGAVIAGVLLGVFLPGGEETPPVPPSAEVASSDEAADAADSAAETAEGAAGAKDAPSAEGAGEGAGASADANAGVTAGCATGPALYCPDASVTRGQISVFILKAKLTASFTPPPCTTPMFGDVPCGNPFAAWINELARRNITAGCGGGNYCPNSPVSRQEMAVFLIRARDEFSPPPPSMQRRDGS